MTLGGTTIGSLPNPHGGSYEVPHTGLGTGHGTIHLYWSADSRTAAPTWDAKGLAHSS